MVDFLQNMILARDKVSFSFLFPTQSSNLKQIDISKIMHTGDQADFYHQSWIGWEYKEYINITGWGDSVFMPNGTMDMPLVQALSRTYLIIHINNI